MPINPLIGQLSDRARSDVGRFATNLITKKNDIFKNSSTVARKKIPTTMRGLSPLRRQISKPKTRGAECRSSEQNIIGTDFVVSKEFTLSMIQNAQENTSITKLELEDMLITEEGDLNVKGGSLSNVVDDPIFLAIKKLLANDGERTWKYIKFIDQIEMRRCGCHNQRGAKFAQQLEKYIQAKELLWSQIDNHAKHKPVMFLIKLVLHEKTSLAQTRELLQVLRKHPVARIEFGGALFQASTTTAPRMLAELFTKEEGEQSNNNNNNNNNSSSSSSSSSSNNKSEGERFCLGELAMLTVTWAKKVCPSRTKALLEDCIDKLNRRQEGGKLTDENGGDLDKSLSNSRNSSHHARRRGRTRSPKRPASQRIEETNGRQPKRTKSLEMLHEMSDSSRRRQDRRRAAMIAEVATPRRSRSNLEGRQ